jgi:hypothetical protein
MVKPIQYELIRCEIRGQKLYFNGIKIDTKQDIKRITHSADYNPIGYVTGDKTVDFSLTEPKDSEMLTILYDTWVKYHTPFTLKLFSQNVDTLAWDMLGALEGCVLNKVDHNLKAKEEWKPNVSGMAIKYTSLRHQFDPTTGGVLNAAKNVLTSVNTATAKASGGIAALETAGKLVGL